MGEENTKKKSLLLEVFKTDKSLSESNQLQVLPQRLWLETCRCFDSSIVGKKNKNASKRFFCKQQEDYVSFDKKKKRKNVFFPFLRRGGKKKEKKTDIVYYFADYKPAGNLTLRGDR